MRFTEPNDSWLDVKNIRSSKAAYDDIELAH